MSYFTKDVVRKAFAMLALCSGLVTVAQAQQDKADHTILSIDRNKIDNTPVLIRFSPDANWRHGDEQQIFKRYLGVDGANTTMRQLYTTTTKMQVTTSRYAEYYKGIKVEFGSYTLTEKNGLISFISGNYYNAGELSATPSLTEAAALNKALQFMGATKYMWQDPSAEENLKTTWHNPDTSYFPKGSLVWIENFNGAARDHKLHLAYSFNIYAQAPLSRRIVYVDAQTGDILYSDNQIKHTAASNRTLYSGVVPFISSRISGPTYTLYDSTRGGGIYTRNVNHNTSVTGVTQINSATNYWPVATADTQAIDVHWGVEKVYDYWFTQQGRNSWDGLGGILLSYVHMNDASGGGNMDNAYWDGSEMCYGDGTGLSGGGFLPLVSLDVTAHELGHGICQATAGLVYQYESGAMNEGLSDCWAATVEHWADPHETDAVPKQYFKIGEEIGGGAPLRSMDYPHNEYNPDTYGTNDPYWYDVVGCTPSNATDECGVHTNSGVTNKWYYLVIMGGTGTNANANAYSVNAIGWTEAANILYQTELALSSTADYAEFRATSIATASAIYGPCSAEVQSVTNAWYAVGVGTAFVPCTPQIGFTAVSISTTEKSASTSCPATHTVSIGVKPSGLAITGGNPLVTVAAAYGTAVAGVDYTLSGSPLTFIAGDTSTHYVTMTIYDNGAVNDTKNLVIGLSLNPMGSTATLAPGFDTVRVTINNDDSVVLRGGPEYHTINVGTAVTCNLTSAFPGSNKRSRTQWIVTAAEMAAAGVRPGVPISQIGFYITSKSSTGAFTGYSLSMANTSATDVGSSFVSTGLVNVFPAASVTTNSGLDTLNFTTTFTWDGTSNVMVQACYGQNGTAYSANDQMMGIQGGSNICDHNQSGTGTGTGCSLTWSSSGTNLSNAHPVMRFKQIVPPSKIATVLASTRTWSIRSGTTVNFWNPSDTALIATLANETASLGCTSATLTGAGTGFTPSAFSASTNRSVKEVTITPTINGATTTYDATIYLTNTELNGVAPATLFLVKTEQPTDATVTAANSVMLTPALITGTNYVGFKGTFTGVTGSRFFLTDGPFCTAPTATVTPSGATTFCTGSSVTLSANTGAGYTYQWQNGTTNIPGATNSNYVATAGGNYRVQITQSSCTGSSTPIAVTVNSVYAAPINPSTGNVCVGASLALTDPTTPGVWSSANTAAATVDASGNVYGIAADTVTIAYRVTNMCGTATVTQIVTVNNNPVVAPITGSATGCTGSTISLFDATPSGIWTSDDPSVATVTSTGGVGGFSSGSVVISYTVTNAAECSASQSTTLTINASPAANITASGPVIFCPASSVTLSAPTGSGLSYQWQSGGINIPGATNSLFNTNTTGNYDVIVTNSSNCSSVSSTIAVTADPTLSLVPAVTITASPGLIMCSVPITLTFTASSVNGGPVPAYSWYVNGAISGFGTSYTYMPASGDQVRCILTSNAACRSSDTASSTVVPIINMPSHPTVAINAIPNDTICTGTMATFAAIPTWGGTTPTYIWNKNGVNVATGPAYNYVPGNGDILKCTMTSNYACRDADTGVSAPLTVTVENGVVNTVTITSDHSGIPPGGSVTFTATAPNGGASPAYQWYINGVAVPGATNATYTTTTLTNGQIVTCSVVSSETCASPATAYSSGISIIVTDGVATLTAASHLSLIPNPNTGTFSITGSLVTSDENVTVRVTNMIGQEIYKAQAPVHNNTIDHQVSLQSSLASGVYLVDVVATNGSHVFHMVVGK